MICREFPDTWIYKVVISKQKIAPWMTGPNVLRGSFLWAFTEGIRALVAAAGSGGPGRRVQQAWSPLTHQVAKTSFEDRLCSLARRCRVDSPGWKKLPNIQLAGAIRRSQVRELRGHPWSMAINAVSVDKFVSAAAELFDKLKVPVRLELSTPVELLQSVHLVLQANQNEIGVRRSEVFAITLLGLAKRGLSDMNRCALCFRWAIPGMPHCYEHTQSEMVGGDRRERLARYQRANRASGAYAQAMQRSRGRLDRVDPSRLPTLIGRILWNTPGVEEDATLKAIRSELIAAPSLSGEFGSDLGSCRPELLPFALQCRMDPLEWDLPRWLLKIRAARVWIDSVHKANPGGRQTGLQTRLRLNDAYNLAATGSTQSEIAISLGLAPSTLSNWLKRYAEPAHPNFVAAARLAAMLEKAKPQRRRRARVKQVVIRAGEK